MIRALLFLLLVLFSSAAAHAQDVLTKASGEELSAKIVEITPSEVKYKRADNPDGPLIVLRRADVFMIRYANGLQEVITPALSTGAAAGATRPAAPAAPAGQPEASVAGVPASATAVPGDETQPFENIHLDGPRLGFTVLTGGVLNKAREEVSDLKPFLTQFGWQFETRLFRLPSGVSAVAEFVPLVGGLEQGKFIPSLSGLLGIRGPRGFEFGVGPNVTPLGANLVLALGTSYRANGINFPVNLAVVPGNGGVRISLLFGFNARKN